MTQQKRPYPIKNKIVSGNNWAELVHVHRWQWLVRVYCNGVVYVNNAPHPRNRVEAFDLAVRLLEGNPE